MHLREATPEDLQLLQYWDEQPHVIEADPNDHWHWATELKRKPSWRSQLIAEEEGNPIGFVQIIDPSREDSNYWGGLSGEYRAIDIWIGEANNIGRGYGSKMMRLAIKQCFSQSGVTKIVVDPLVSNRRARAFYEKLGFKYIEDRMFGSDNCAIYQLEWPGT